MKVYINETSVDRQAQDHQDAMSILSELAKVVSKSRAIAYEGKAFRTRGFSEREIIRGVTVKAVLVEAVAKQSLKEEIARKLTLQTLMARPFTEDYHLDTEDFIHDEDTGCLKNSCFDDASGSLSGSLMISAKNNSRCSCNFFYYKSSIFGLCFSHNVNSEEMLDAITWMYEHNTKHGKISRLSAGVEISEMDLTHEHAQIALSNGIKVNSRIYGYFNGHWYQFHCHHANKYHGFKIVIKESNPEHMAALKKLTSLGFKGDCGQVFLSV